MVHSFMFDFFMGVVVVLNVILIGQQLDAEVSGGDEEKMTIFHIVEVVFYFIYVAELAARFFSVGLACLRNPWVRFDLLIVVILLGPNRQGAVFPSKFFVLSWELRFCSISAMI